MLEHVRALWSIYGYDWICIKYGCKTWSWDNGNDKYWWLGRFKSKACQVQGDMYIPWVVQERGLLDEETEGCKPAQMWDYHSLDLIWVQYGYLANKKNQLGGSCGMPKLKQVPLISWTITCTKRHTHQRAKGEMEQWLGSITPIYQGYLESSEPFIQL